MPHSLENSGRRTRGQTGRSPISRRLGNKRLAVLDRGPPLWSAGLTCKSRIRVPHPSAFCAEGGRQPCQRRDRLKAPDLHFSPSHSYGRSNGITHRVSTVRTTLGFGHHRGYRMRRLPELGNPDRPILKILSSPRKHPIPHTGIRELIGLSQSLRTLKAMRNILTPLKGIF